MSVGEVPAALKVQENPLFSGPGVADVPEGMEMLEIVLGSLHPCIREAAGSKDKATRQMMSAHAMLSTAARLLMMATAGHLPDHSAAHNAFAVTDTALRECNNAVQRWHAADAEVVRRLLQHPPPTQEELRLLKEYTEFTG